MKFDSNVGCGAEVLLEGACALDVVVELQDAFAGEAEAEDMIDGQ